MADYGAYIAIKNSRCVNQKLNCEFNEKLNLVSGDSENMDLLLEKMGEIGEEFIGKNSFGTILNTENQYLYKENISKIFFA